MRSCCNEAYSCCTKINQLRREKNISGASYHCDITKKKLFEQLLCAKMILIYSIMIMMIYSINSRGEGEERNRKGNP